MRPAHPCPVPTCAVLLRTGEQCPVHPKPQRTHDPEQRKFYNSYRWQQIRKQVKLNQPICGMCHRRPTQQAHHRDDNWRNNEPENHQGVCNICHREHSGREHKRKQASG